MDKIPSEIKEAFAYAEKWNTEAENDIKRGELASAIHIYKAIGNKLIEEYKRAPTEYLDGLGLSIKTILGQMDLIISKTTGKKKKQKQLCDIIMLKKIRDDIRRFLGRIKSSPYTQVSIDDSTILLELHAAVVSTRMLHKLRRQDERQRFLETCFLVTPTEKLHAMFTET